MSNRRQWVLRIAGLAFCAVGLWPHYSHTSDPTMAVGWENVEMPGVGAVPDRPSETEFCVGLPSSPLFHYRKATKIQSETISVPPNTEVQAKSGVTVTGSGEAVVANVTWKIDTKVHYVSWSTLLLFVGIALLVVSLWPRRGTAQSHTA
ncbi:MAG: hypothetical protein U0746_07760 [Gemmataceae bacterium]